MHLATVGATIAQKRSKTSFDENPRPGPVCMCARRPEDLAHQVDDMDPCVCFNPTVIKDTVFGVKNP